jgi:CheY-like chemotaxis protein
MNNDPFKLLLADDDENDRLLFSDALKELKINTELKMVNDGIELMHYLNVHQQDMPQLLFLDLNMPKKNGFECLKEIRSIYGKDLTVVIFSTSIYDKHIEETFQNGANVYMNKPNNFEELKVALNKVILAAFNYQDTFFNKDNFLLKV